MEKESPSPRIFIPDWWSKAADSIAFDSCTSPPPITFVCGAKNSGKSTFSRHLLNTLVPRYKKVAYLDTDVGQPEFTTPGCLSIHIIDEVTPDLTTLSMKTPERCIFFGDTSSKRDPKAYLSSIYQLYDYYHTEYYQSDKLRSFEKFPLPLVINTPGWVKGIGYEIIVEMLRYMQPTHVVQIRISAEKKNLPSGPFWIEGNQIGDVNLINLNAALQDSSNRSLLIKNDSRLLREARIIAYFRQCFPRSFHITTNKELAHALASHTPYEVPLSKVKVLHLHCTVSGNEILHSLNATIVGLAVDRRTSQEAEGYARWCVGLGIIRGVDMLKGLLYVLTPVPLSHLDKVNVLLQGYIEIPACLLQERRSIKQIRCLCNVLFRFFRVKMAAYGGAPRRGSVATTTTIRRRVRGAGARPGVNVMLQFYADDDRGTKIGPITVLIMSIGFIAFVALLHVLGKLYFVPRGN